LGDPIAYTAFDVSFSQSAAGGAKKKGGGKCRREGLPTNDTHHTTFPFVGFFFFPFFQAIRTVEKGDGEDYMPELCRQRARVGARSADAAWPWCGRQLSYTRPRTGLPSSDSALVPNAYEAWRRRFLCVAISPVCIFFLCVWAAPSRPGSLFARIALPSSGLQYMPRTPLAPLPLEGLRGNHSPTPAADCLWPS